MNLLLFKVNHLGDNVVFLPVVQQLRRTFPQARLLVVTTPTEAPLYHGLSAPAQVFAPAERATFNHVWRRRPWALPGWIARVGSFRADASLISYDQGNLTHLLARFFGGAVRVGANMTYVRVRHSTTHLVPPPADWNVVHWNWAMGRTLARALATDADWPETPPPPDLSHLAPRSDRGATRRVVIHAGTKMAIRQWPLQRYAELADRLSRDHEVIWIERPETRDVTLPPKIHVARPSTLTELVVLLAGARLYVGNNSGPMHVANALGCRGVIISGPSAYGWDPYWYRDRWQVLRHPALSCLPCETPNVGVERCANLAAPLACLQYWTVDAVEAACRDSLAAQIAE